MTREGARDGRASLILVALLAAAPLLPALLSGRTLYYRDVGQYYIPNRLLTMSAIHEGHLPLWNPQRGNGQPFLANPNSFVLRPTTLLFLPFPAHLVHIPMLLSVAALFILTAAGTWALLRDAGLSGGASIVGAAAFSLSGPVQSLGQLLNHLEGVAFIPLTLWALGRSFTRGWRPWGVIAGLLFGLVVSAGEPVWIGVTILAALALPAIERPAARRAGLAAGVAFLIGLLVASAQLLPLADNVLLSERGSGLKIDEVLKWSLPPQALLGTAIPGFWGDPTRSDPAAYWGAGLFDSSLPWLLSIHLGAPTLLLAALGALASLRTVGGRAAVLAGLGALLALGRYTPLYPFLIDWVPGAGSVRYPVKWMILTAWCVAVLAALGFDAITKLEAGGRAARRGSIVAAALAALVFVTALGASIGALPGLPAIARVLVSAPAGWTDEILLRGAVPGIAARALLASGALLLLLLLRPREGADPGSRTRLRAALCVSVLVIGAWGLNPSAPPDVVFAPSPLLRSMPDAAGGTLRFFGLPRPPRFAFRNPSPDEAEVAGIPGDSLAWGMRWDGRTLRNATYFRWGLRGAYDRLGDSRLDLLPGSAVARRLGEEGPLPETIRLLAAASAGYFLAYGDLDDPALREVASLPGESSVPVKLYRILGAVPRASVVDRALPSASVDEALRKIASGGADPRVEVLLGPEGTGEETAPAGSRGAGEESPGSAMITTDGYCDVGVRVEARRAGWLVLTDTFEPSWRATLDGAPASILRANGMFRAVKVPPGSHDVRFSYLPRSFVIGGTLSLLTLAVSTLLIAGSGRRGEARRSAGTA